MLDWLVLPFDRTRFLPHWHSGEWSTQLVWLHIAADVAMSLAYTALPAMLVFVWSRRCGAGVPRVFWLLAAFALWCGFGHFVDAAAFWLPLHRLAGAVKLGTAFLGWASVIALWRYLPHALRLPNISRENALLQQEVGRLLERQSALEAQRAAAAAASRTKSQFLAHMSHEIRTPLTAILGYSDMLLATLEQPEQLDAARTIKRNSEHLLEILNDILDFSKIEAGRLDVECVRCSPAQILTDVASLLQVRAAAKGLTLKIESDGPLPEVITTDPTRLRQILLNLVANAIKFTEAGEVRIVARTVCKSGEPWRLEVDVIDTGIGISPEQMRRLFQPFSQADASTTRTYGGSGLGLAISRQLARLLGGDLQAVSVPGQGSTFTLSLGVGSLHGVPLVKMEDALTTVAADAPSVQDPTSGLLKGRCILVADDAPDNRRLVACILRNAGAEVHMAENGRQVVEMALSTSVGWGRRWYDCPRRYDAILMDLEMSLLDGREATRFLRQRGYTQPIIALTAHALDEHRRTCLEAGCTAFAPKPVQRDPLVRLIASLLPPTRTADLTAGTKAEGGSSSDSEPAATSTISGAGSTPAPSVAPLELPAPSSAPGVAPQHA